MPHPGRLHDDELIVDTDVVRTVLREQCPEWADLPVRLAGSGTDNTMFRLGDDLLLRMPRSLAKAASLRTELTWLPRLGPHLPCGVPVPVLEGRASTAHPLPWAVYGWIEGEVVSPGTVEDWARLGHDLGAVVVSLHAVDLAGQTRAGELSWYRGGRLAEVALDVEDALNGCAGLVRAGELELDVGTLRHLWREAVALRDPTAALVWLHGDLRPANLLARGGCLEAVIDFGALSVGWPDAEHAAVWDLPAPARQAYWAAVDLDDTTFLRARGWAIGVAALGVPYYWRTYAAFVDECLARLRAVLDGGAGRHW